MVAAILFITFAILLLIGAPIAVCLGISSVAAMIAQGAGRPLEDVYKRQGLVTDAMKEKPENYILYTVVGVLFLIIGAACCLFNLKKYIKHEYRDPFKDAIEAVSYTHLPDLSDTGNISQVRIGVVDYDQIHLAAFQQFHAADGGGTVSYTHLDPHTFARRHIPPYRWPGGWKHGRRLLQEAGSLPESDQTS